jgi:hypothetical protein
MKAKTVVEAVFFLRILMENCGKLRFNHKEHREHREKKGGRMSLFAGLADLDIFHK